MAASFVKFSADFNETASHKPALPAPVVFLISAYAVLSVVGVIANLLEFLLILRLQKKTLVDVLVLNLAVSDLLVCVYLSLIATTYSLKEWVFGGFLCKVYGLVSGMNIFSTAVIFSAIATERYVLIGRSKCLGTKKVQKVSKSVLMWSIILILSSPLINNFYLSTNFHGIPRCFFFSFPLKLLYDIATVVAMYVVPICLAVAAFLLRRKRSLHSDARMITLYRPIIVFTLCWLPYTIIDINPSLANNDPYVFAFVQLLCRSTPFLDPFLFIWFSFKDWRHLVSSVKTGIRDPENFPNNDDEVQAVKN